MHATNREVIECRIKCPLCLRWADPIRGLPKKDELRLVAELKTDFEEDDDE
jgi:hypothetical protein